jgi:hypothetical protein
MPCTQYLGPSGRPLHPPALLLASLRKCQHHARKRLDSPPHHHGLPINHGTAPQGHRNQRLCRASRVRVINSVETSLIPTSVVAALAAQIHQACVLRAHPTDQTFYAWKYYVAVIFVQGLSIITVCIPWIRNLLLGIESGMIQTGHFGLPTHRSMSKAEISLRTFFSSR